MSANPDSAAPQAAYIHVPFCRRRCGYCNFTLVAGRDDLIEPFLTALEVELATLGEPRPMTTLFFGGGTPTHLPPAALERLLSLVRKWLPSTADCEWSVEANPNDISAELIAQLAAAGVNRLSLGVQSLSDAKLSALEREHTAADVARAVALARPAMRSLAIDLIFAAPGETVDDWCDDLQAALDLQPDHVSTYGLTYERGAAFYGRLQRGDLQPADEEAEREMYLTAIDTLTAAGLEHYEVSNFARPGHRCRHNEVYWNGGEYFAFGPGAARHIAGRREMNHRSTSTYIHRLTSGQTPVAESEQLPPEAAARERLVFALRRLAGISAAEFRRATGFTIEELVGPLVRRHCDSGLLRFDGERLQLTRAGLLVSDAIWPDFLSE